VVSWADVFYLASSGLVMAALLSFPMIRLTRVERWKLGLDGAIVLIGGAVAIWYFTVRPTASAESDPLVTAVLGFAYPLTALLILYAITAVSIQGVLDRNRTAFWLLVGSVLIAMVADLVFGLVLIELEMRTANWSDGLYLLSYLCAVAGVETYSRHPVAELRPDLGEPGQERQVSPLPYLAIASTYLLLLAAALGRGRTRPADRCRSGGAHGHGGRTAGAFRPAKRAASGGSRRRGPVPFPGPALIRSDPRGRSEWCTPVRKSLRGPGAAARSGAAGRQHARRPGAA
jgi:hypothetical protein